MVLVCFQKFCKLDVRFVRRFIPVVDVLKESNHQIRSKSLLEVKEYISNVPELYFVALYSTSVRASYHSPWRKLLAVAGLVIEPPLHISFFWFPRLPPSYRGSLDEGRQKPSWQSRQVCLLWFALNSFTRASICFAMNLSKVTFSFLSFSICSSSLEIFFSRRSSRDWPFSSAAVRAFLHSWAC